MRTLTIGGGWLMLVLATAPLVQGASQPAPSERDTKVTVTVDATHPWVGSGVTVRKGERLTFMADGSIRWGTKSDQISGPEGHTTKPGKLGAGGLIGRVG